MMRADAVACLRTDTRREQQGRRETTRGGGGGAKERKKEKDGERQKWKRERKRYRGAYVRTGSRLVGRNRGVGEWHCRQRQRQRQQL